MGGEPMRSGGGEDGICLLFGSVRLILQSVSVLATSNREALCAFFLQSKWSRDGDQSHLRSVTREDATFDPHFETGEESKLDTVQQDHGLNDLALEPRGVIANASKAHFRKS